MMSEPMAAQRVKSITLPWQMLLCARVVWLAIVVFVMALCYASMPDFMHALEQPCAGAACQLDGGLTAADLHYLQAPGISARAYAIYTVVLLNVVMLIWLAVGVLIFLRRGHDVGVLVIALVLAVANPSAANGPITALAMHHPAWSLPIAVLTFLSNVSFFTLFLLFPDGRFVPRWTVWLAVLTVAQDFVSAFLPPNFLLNAPSGPGYVISTATFLGVAACVLYAQIYRYRHASTERQRAQTKWAVFWLVTALVGVLALNVASSAVQALEGASPSELLLNTLFPLILLCIPVSIGVAILRSRLYDIDLIINRTLVYGTLTALLAAIYFAGVVGAQGLVNTLERQPRQQSPVVVVLTTLVIAALFQPLRRSIQAFIDHRFYRRKYDAAKTLSRFSAALRSEVDLSTLSEHLVSVVDETMQPAQVSLWLRSPAGVTASASNQSVSRDAHRR